jgi:uncharacterized SAM-binding protein YcdF (DUF218 family)
VRAALALLGLMLVVVTVTPLESWYARALAGPWDDPEGDVLILLGAESPADRYIGQETYWRSVYAARAWRDGHFRTIVVCGGGGVAESIRDYLVFAHVPAEHIVLESRSSSTHENALFAAEILKDMPGTKVLLTSDFHMYRSIRAFRKAGIEAAPRPIPDALKRVSNWFQRLPLFVVLATETAKIAGYQIRGWI